VEIGTDFGNLHFSSKENKEIIESMQKHLTFIGIREPSDNGGKGRNDSSSFLKNNTSTEFKLSYDKSMNSNSDLSRVLKTPLDRPEKDKHSNNNGNKAKTLESMLKDLLRKWKEAEFFADDSFKKVMSKSGEKRRDYEYHSGHSKFYLRELKEYRLVDKDLIFKYKWKVSFPESQMLHSFRHEQEVRIENISKDLRIRIVPSKYS
jgi:hypothetical protein